MTVLNFLGNCGGSSGYSVHSYNLLKALIRKGVNINSEYKLNHEHFERIPYGGKLRYHTPTLAITLIEELIYKRHDRNKPFIPYVVFEGDKLNKTWTRILKEKWITALITPSNSTKEAILNSGINKNIYIVPHGVDFKTYNPKVPKHPKMEEDDRFKFLMIGGWRGCGDRKGFQYGLKAYAEEFDKGDPVVIYVKVNGAYGIPNIQAELDKMNLPENRPDIHFVVHDLNPSELAMMYMSSDVMVSPHLQESWGMCISEAMACGTPVIINGVGGPLDYVNTSCGYIVEPEGLIKSSGVPNYIYEGVKWAKPSVTNLRIAMRHAFENKDELLKKGLNAYNSVSPYSWEHSAQVIMDVFKNEGVDIISQ